MSVLTGELMGVLVVELARGEAGRSTGEAAAAVGVGEGTAEGSWAGTGEGHTGLLAAVEGDGVVLMGFVSSGMNGSGKKRVPGDLARASGDGLSGERTSSFCTGLMLDGSMLEATSRLSDFLSSSGNTSSACSD